MLWVDDDSSINRMAERVLPRHGFDVTVASDAAGAMQAMQRALHQAIVLDQRLPGSSDLEPLRKLREVGDSTPVVVLTGHESLEAATEALTLGVIDYLVKPAHTERILSALRIAVRAQTCAPLKAVPTLSLHPDASLALVSILFNVPRASEGQLRTQLAWAVADEGLSFTERVAAVEALGKVLEPLSDKEMREHVDARLRRGLRRPFALRSLVLRTFAKLITIDAARTWHSKTEVLAAETGTSKAELSRLTHEELSVTPDRCRLIGHLAPALRELAHSNEQVAQIAYQHGYNLCSAFDNVFNRLWGKPPSAYRALLTGVADEA